MRTVQRNKLKPEIVLENPAIIEYNQMIAELTNIKLNFYMNLRRTYKNG